MLPTKNRSSIYRRSYFCGDRAVRYYDKLALDLSRFEWADFFDQDTALDDISHLFTRLTAENISSDINANPYPVNTYRYENHCINPGMVTKGEYDAQDDTDDRWYYDPHSGKILKAMEIAAEIRYRLLADELKADLEIARRYDYLANESRA